MGIHDELCDALTVFFTLHFSTNEKIPLVLSGGPAVGFFHYY